MLISIKEYAERNGRSASYMRRKALNGGFKTAVKIGRDWLIDDGEPLTDNRIKSGEYIDWRKGDKK